jgi:hypothetical protein
VLTGPGGGGGLHGQQALVMLGPHPEAVPLAAVSGVGHRPNKYFAGLLWRVAETRIRPAFPARRQQLTGQRRQGIGRTAQISGTGTNVAVGTTLMQPSSLALVTQRLPNEATEQVFFLTSRAQPESAMKKRDRNGGSHHLETV